MITKWNDLKEQEYQKAVDLVFSSSRASASYIQRQLKTGFDRAAEYIERMESEKLIGAPNYFGKREILTKAKEA